MAPVELKNNVQSFREAKHYGLKKSSNETEEIHFGVKAKGGVRVSRLHF